MNRITSDLEIEYPQLCTPVVHQLIHQMQQPVGVFLYMFQLLVQPSVTYLIHHFLYGGEYQGQWRAQFVRDVDEETELHFVHFFLSLFVHPFHLELGLHTFTHPEVAEYEYCNRDESRGEHQHGPPCFIPYR